MLGDDPIRGKCPFAGCNKHSNRGSSTSGNGATVEKRSCQHGHYWTWIQEKKDGPWIRTTPPEPKPEEPSGNTST